MSIVTPWRCVARAFDTGDHEPGLSALDGGGQGDRRGSSRAVPELYESHRLASCLLLNFGKPRLEIKRIVVAL